MKSKGLRRYFDKEKASAYLVYDPRESSLRHDNIFNTKEGDYYKVGNSNVCFSDGKPDRVMAFMAIMRYIVEILSITISVVWFFGFINVELSKIYNQLSTLTKQDVVITLNQLVHVVILYGVTLGVIAKLILSGKIKNMVTKVFIWVVSFTTIFAVFPFLAPVNRNLLIVVLIGGSVLKRLGWIGYLVIIASSKNGNWNPGPEDYVFSVEKDTTEYHVTYPSKGWEVNDAKEDTR
ncbi:hypothetical protein G7062_10500 [Erysipelothrix sp. HDW6C]|uniref:hypothetical protein n=1 Tax=Erysipelothrix sp. HDW6C TaxID=2714930 RepID=UPI001408402B|nr:hypothetical protein [Erysipelothrix sp. HDW6C]QIK70706.1 hypothetical protein G7062_10500 [Erysipelothrix sp. HDW6C]